MDEVTTWKASIFLDEHDGRTRARAELRTADRTLTGEGLARLRPGEPDVPAIGDELAAARALADLAHQLLDYAAGDVEAILHAPVHITS